ncbi:MAG: sugar ABC transporter permease, partial [Trichococcus flocculiformis]
MMKSDVTIPKEKTLSTVTPTQRKRKMTLWGWFFIAPTLIGLLILNVIPLFQSLYMSFQSVSTFGASTFVGLDNYLQMLQDPEFWQSLKNTFFYAGIQVPITIILALFFAVLMNTKIKAVGLYRTIFFLPMIAAPAAVAMVWRWLFNAEYGLLNAVLDKLGYSGNILWITDPEVAIWSIIIVGIWTNVGY